MAIPFSIEGDQPLKIGNEYLFASLTHPNGQWQTVVDVDGTIEVTSEAERAELVEVSPEATARPISPEDYAEQGQVN